MTHEERWAALTAPFPKDAYKTVNIGRQFVSIDAYHVMERIAAVFGLAGKGWGTRVDRWETSGTDVAAIGVLWWRDGEGRHEVQAVGEGRVMKQAVAEAMKKAQTNLISKAASYMGVGLGVYQGKGVDDPYLDRQAEMGHAPAPAERREQPPRRQPAAAKPAPAPAPAPVSTPAQGPRLLGTYEPTRQRFHALGVETYGDGWDAKRAEFCAKMGAESSNDLTMEQATLLILGMEAKKKGAAK
mgnify:CR=1 FL=1